MTDQEPFLKDYKEEDSTILEEELDVASKKIDWSQIPSNVLGPDDILLLSALEGTEDELLAPRADLINTFEDSDQALAIAAAFVKVLELRSPDHLKYILTLLCSLLQSDDRRGDFFLKLNNPNLLQSFIRVWTRDDLSQYCRGKAAICGSIILRWGDEKLQKEHESLNQWVLREFSNKNDNLLSPLYALKGVIKNEYFQELFCKQRGIERLNAILVDCPDHRQVVYLTVYCLWAISFNPKLRTHEHLLRGVLIERLCNLVKLHISTKVVRVVLAMFENLTGVGEFNEMVVLYELFPELNSLQEQESKLDDQELQGSVNRLLEDLEHSVRTLSSFERYCMEISTQKFIKGPCHTTKFWKRYSRNLEDDNYKLVKALVKLLDSDDIETVQWACYDIGQWARFYPNAKFVIEQLNAKYKLMNLIERPEPIKSKALNAVQSLLVKNWMVDETKEDK